MADARTSTPTAALASGGSWRVDLCEVITEDGNDAESPRRHQLHQSVDYYSGNNNGQLSAFHSTAVPANSAVVHCQIVGAYGSGPRQISSFGPIQKGGKT